MIHRIASKEWTDIDKPKSEWESSVTDHVKGYDCESRQI